MKPRLVWLLLCLIWGSTWLFIKIGLEDLPPFTFAGIRFVISCSILFALIGMRGIPLPRRRSDWGLLAVTGLLTFSINYGLVFWGEQYISSGLAAVLQSMMPGFGMLLAHLYLPKERITALRIVGVVMGIVGVAVIFSNQLSVSGRRALLGSAALVLSALSGAYSNVLVKAKAKHLDPSVTAAGQMLFGLFPLLALGLLLEGNPMRFHWTQRAVISVLYLAIVGTVIAFVLYYWLIQHMDVTNTLLISLITPVVAVILGMLVLNERLTWRTLAGGAMIISGIGLIVLKRVRKSEGELVASV
ncbi:MAG: DMT family transporter [Pyrinomonadaceae bacterium]